jgi:hypothetical protein
MDILAAILAAILDFSVNEDFRILDKYKFEFVDTTNLYKDTKIVVISASEAEI